MRFKLICVLAAALALASAATAAFAARPGAYTCSGGLIEAGTYNGLNVTGPCLFDYTAGGTIPTITVDGNLTVAPGASLNADHATSLGNLTVTGNVTVGKGGILGLGNYGRPAAPGNTAGLTTTIVDGNVIADQPETLYLSFMTIRGNLVSNGGTGPVPSAGTSMGGINFPLKNLTVGGNVEVQGWNGWWIGLFRSQVGGNVIFSKNTGTKIGEDGEPDSSEIATNVISGNLICQGDSPAAQIGDSGGSLNMVGGQAIGQCADLVAQP